MKTIIVLSHIRWNGVFKRPQQIFSRLAQHYKIIFVEEPISNCSVFIEATQVAPNVTTLLPHTVESGFGFNDAQMAVIAPMVKAWLIEYADLEDGYGLWFYTPQALTMKDSFAPEFIVFDVMDELTMFDHAPTEIKAREAELLRIADVVIAGGPSLARAKQEVRPDTLSLPSSVDAEHYAPKTTNDWEASGAYGSYDISKIGSPRIGFFGGIDERLDIELVTKIADNNPRWHVVMVGPIVKIDPSILPERDNIHWLGSKPYAELPSIVQTWEVCVLPFAINKATKFISPTKTLEYLASEKPVVSTAIHDVIELYGSVVEIGYDHDEFISKIELILAEDAVRAAERVINGKNVVANYSWDETSSTIHQAIEDVIALKQLHSASYTALVAK